MAEIIVIENEAGVAVGWVQLRVVEHTYSSALQFNYGTFDPSQFSEEDARQFAVKTAQRILTPES